MKRAYIYPVSARDKNLGLYNPYLDDFIDSTGKYVVYVNKDDPSKLGVFNILKYLFKIDYIFFNWIEKVPEFKGGTIQSYFVLYLLRMSKMLRIRVVWTMHNKLSHSTDHIGLKRKIFRSLLKNADLIITHSSEGIKFGDEMVKGSANKIFYLPHPVKDRRIDSPGPKEIDILIWGTIAPYKGIDNFLDFLYQKKLEHKFRIHIVGKITDPTYAEKLKKYGNQQITIENAFIEDDILQDLISKSTLILFTYSKSSILSSGALMDSLGYGTPILGPEVGAFADLAKAGVLDTYSNFDELTKKIDFRLNNTNEVQKIQQIDEFLNDNSWEKFAYHLSEKL